MRITKFVLIVFAACLSISKCQAANEEAAELHDIENISQLKTLFNQQKGTARLIVIFSPT